MLVIMQCDAEYINSAASLLLVIINRSYNPDHRSNHFLRRHIHIEGVNRQTNQKDTIRRQANKEKQEALTDCNAQ